MILVFGKNGQVARALAEKLVTARFFDSLEANFLNRQQVINILEEYKPKIIINAAAYTNVDKAEDEKDLAFQINCTTPKIIAEWATKNKSVLIHFSTDYVFSGEGQEPWLEDSPTGPINWYGKTKLLSEQAILDSNCDYYIFRISWVYSDWGKNFKNTIIRLAQSQETLKVVNDQFGSPTDARDVARVVSNTTKVLLSDQERPPFGTYHLRFEPYQSWFDFAESILRNNKIENKKVKTLLPCLSSEYVTQAQRPKNSRLSSKHAYDLFK